MPGQVSRFSTAANFQSLNEAKDKFESAIAEAKVAVAAGVPGAEAQLKAAEDGLARTNKVLQVYFPGGVAPAAG